MLLKIENNINDINIYYKSRYNSGYAFIEFDSYVTAKKIIQKFNGLFINGQHLILNWAKDNSNNYRRNNKTYTVSNIYFNLYSFSFI